MKHFFLISIFWLCHRQYETLVTQSGIEPSPPALEAWSLNHWTAREVMRGTFCGSNQTSSDDKSCGQSIFLPEYASHPLPHALVLPILESQPQGLIWPRWNAPDPLVIICAHYATYVSFLVFFIVIVQSFICVHCLWPHGLQRARLSCPSRSPRACSNSCPLNQWCHPTTLYS